MAPKARFRYFDVRIDKDKVKEDIIDLLLSLKPNWTKDDLCQQEYSDGYVNSMTCFYQRTDEKRNDALVARVYGLEGHDLPVEREKELLTMQVAHAAGCFPTIFGAFKNGIIYEYEPGRIVNFHDLIKPDIVKKVAHQLYRFQHIDVDSLELVDRNGVTVKYDKTPKTFESLPIMIQKIPTDPKSERNKNMFHIYRKTLTDEYLMREYEFVNNTLDDVKLPLALNHGDFHPRNMIINDETGKVTFIDYEVSTVNHEVNDLSRFFGNKEMYDKYNLCKPDEPDITDDIRSLYLREYLNAKHEKEGRMDDVVTDKEMEILDTQLRIMEISSTFSFLILSLLLVDIPFKDLNFLDTLGDFIAKYETAKNDLPMLRDKYLQLIGKQD